MTCKCFCILYFWNTQQKRGNKCKAVFYTYKQIGMPSLELFWPCSTLAKNLGDVLACGLSIACCFPHLCMVVHHCHGKRINLTAKKKLKAKGKTSQQKEKDWWQNFFDAERTFFLFFSFAVWLFFLP